MAMSVHDKDKTYFQDMAVYKDPAHHRLFSSLSIPSYLRDWVVMRFADENGKIDAVEVEEYVRNNIPSKKDWELLKSRMIKDGQKVKFLAKVRV
jgi:ATP-dependent Lon protease